MQKALVGTSPERWWPTGACRSVAFRGAAVLREGARGGWRAQGHGECAVVRVLSRVCRQGGWKGPTMCWRFTQHPSRP